MSSTGELKTAMTIDRESPLVTNNMYNITVKAVDKSEYICYRIIDACSKTAIFYCRYCVVSEVRAFINYRV